MSIKLKACCFINFVLLHQHNFNRAIDVVQFFFYYLGIMLDADMSWKTHVGSNGQK